MVILTDDNKIPGSDGYNFGFFKSLWEEIKSDIFLMFQQFHLNSKIPKSFSSYFILLIPKMKSPDSLWEFQQISLLRSLYKLLVKVLAIILGAVMDQWYQEINRCSLKEWTGWW